MEDTVFSGPAADLMAGVRLRAATAGVAAAYPFADAFVLDTDDGTDLDARSSGPTPLDGAADAERVTRAVETALSEAACGSNRASPSQVSAVRLTPRGPVRSSLTSGVRPRRYALDDRTREAARAMTDRDRSEFLPDDPVAFVDDQLAALADAPLCPAFNVRSATLGPSSVPPPSVSATTLSSTSTLTAGRTRCALRVPGSRCFGSRTDWRRSWKQQRRQGRPFGEGAC